MTDDAGPLRIGTSSWSASSWEGVFYPPGTPSVEYLRHYASRFDTVEVDATFYRIPSERMVDGWRDRTPPGFLFAAKIPQVITHEKLLEGCGDEFGTFLRVMDRLGDKLGPLLFQFRYFRKAEFPDPRPFIEKLERFFPALPEGHRFAVEVRNKTFVTPRFLELLHRYRVALAFIDHPWFHRIDAMMKQPAALTADFAYIRWLGDRRGIGEMAAWVPAIRTMLDGGRAVYGYFNNHYAGYAVGSVELFQKAWNEREARA
jgi:uncharacterized protein YecE (DUF72 family)